MYVIPLVLILALSMVPALSEEYTDVAIIDIKITPENPKVGEHVEGKITIQNLGNVRTKIGFSVDVEGPRGGGGMGGFGIKLRPGEVVVLPVSFDVNERGAYRVSANVFSVVYDKNLENNKAVIKIIVE